MHIILAMLYHMRAMYYSATGDVVSQVFHIRICSVVAHAHLLHPVQARDLINQLAKKLARCLSNGMYEAKKQRAKSTT